MYISRPVGGLALSSADRDGARQFLNRSLLACLLAGVAAAPVLAQPVPAPPGADKPAVVGEVIVTGSRISRRDFQSDSPISTVNSEAIASAGQPSLDKAIGELPQFSGAQGASEVGDAQGSLGFAGGQSYSDLRGLGPNRSLVLLDGRRLQPSAPDGSIDLNTIPTALIDNVEVITGGASATYGSDAIAGVVNFKLRQKLNGVELSATHGETTHGDGATNDFSVIAGGNFADSRGSALFAFEYADRAAVDGASRTFFQNIRQLARPPEGIIAAGNFGGGAPTIAAVNSVLAGYAGTTPIAGSGAYKGAIGVNTDGTIFTQNAAPNCVQNYKGLGTIKGINISPNCTAAEVALGQYFAVQVPLTKYNVFARTTYDLTDHVSAYAQFNFSDSTALDQTGPGSSKAAIPLIVPLSSPYVTGNAALQTILNSIDPATKGPLVVTKLLTPFGNRVETLQLPGLAGPRRLQGPGAGDRAELGCLRLLRPQPVHQYRIRRHQPECDQQHPERLRQLLRQRRQLRRLRLQRAREQSRSARAAWPTPGAPTTASTPRPS